MVERARWEERLAQAERDLRELDQQLADGEIAEAAGARLGKVYRAEMAQARRQLTELAAEEPDGENPGANRGSPSGFWNTGRVVIVAILGLAAAALVISVGWFTQIDPTPAAEDSFDPSRYSNETMEAVITSNADHPQINGMRLALAARYFGDGDFARAFPHYREVLNRQPNAGEEAEALGRLGWMAWAGSGETQLALDTLDRALESVPSHPQTLYFKAIVLWCGAGQPQEAVPLLEEVTAALPSETEVVAELAAARANEDCR